MSRMTAVCVGDVMSRPVPVVYEETPFKQIARILSKNAVRAVVVVDVGDRVLGLVSESDLILRQAATANGRSWADSAWPWARRGHRKAEAMTARDLMTSPVVTTFADAPVSVAARIAVDHDVSQLPVVAPSGALVGIVARGDLLKVFLRDDADLRIEIVNRVVVGEFSLDPATIEVSVHDGVVTLSGQVEHSNLHPLLADTVRAVPGVVSVEDQLSWAVNDAARPRVPIAHHYGGY